MQQLSRTIYGDNEPAGAAASHRIAFVLLGALFQRVLTLSWVSMGYIVLDSLGSTYHLCMLDTATYLVKPKTVTSSSSVVRAESRVSADTPN